MMIYQSEVAAFQERETESARAQQHESQLISHFVTNILLIELLCDTLSAMTRADLVGTTPKDTETFVSKITATNYCSWALRSIRDSHQYISIASVAAVPFALEEDCRCTCANLGRHVIKSRKIKFSLKSIYQPLEVICVLRFLIPQSSTNHCARLVTRANILSQWQTWTLNIQDCRK